MLLVLRYLRGSMCMRFIALAWSKMLMELMWERLREVMWVLRWRVSQRWLRGLCRKIVMSRSYCLKLLEAIFCYFQSLFGFEISILTFSLHHWLADKNEAILDFLLFFLFLKIRFGVALSILFDKNLQHVLILYNSYLSSHKNSTNTHLILEQEHG